MNYYHATSEEAFNSILNDGEIKTGIERIVYLADSVDNAIKFLCFRLINQPIYILEVDIPEGKMNLIEEQFDHSEAFFKCKAWGYSENIPMSWVTNVYVSNP